MPSERFLRLPEEKRELIYQIAMDEFVHVPLEKVSINRIIQKAGISRGCFYTYFEDKRELLIWVLKQPGNSGLKKASSAWKIIMGISGIPQNIFCV